MTDKLAIYQAKNGAIELNVDARHETIWATQAQIAQIFDVTPQNITIHIGNIYKDNELDKGSTCKQYLQVQEEGDRRVQRKVTAYNLDVLIAVGYRISSLKGTNFRQWATKTLKSYIADGFVLNKKLIQRNYAQFLKAIDDIKLLSSSADDSLELIKAFASTWFSLDAFDKGDLPAEGATKKQVHVTAGELTDAIHQLKVDLVDRGQATELFAQDRGKDALEAIVGNVFQSFGGDDVYPSLEEKAAHLLYFVVKNHPFADGNKRSGAFTFVWYLQRAGVLAPSQITPTALTALTLLIAQSDPSHKDRMIGLVLLLLGKAV